MIKCKTIKCPGVAYYPDKGLCLYGTYQSNPTNGDQGIIEVWMIGEFRALDEFIILLNPFALLFLVPDSFIEPLERYEVGTTQAVLLPRNHCELFPDWTRKPNGKAYKFVSQPMTWKDSLAHCHDQGSNMMMVTSKEEENTLMELSGKKK